MDLAGRKAIVTGTRRLGRAVALGLGRSGSDVALFHRASREPAESAAREIEAMGRRAIVLEADLTDAGRTRAAVDEAAAGLGGLDVLVNAASIYRPRDLAETGPEEWEANMSANARAALDLTRAAVPHMKAGGGGHVIHFTDWLPASGRPRYKGYVAYYASKAALVGLTESLALELAPDRILVNAIAPGPILPHDTISEAENAEVIRNTPLGRWGGEESVTQAVLALLMCDFVTGEVLRVDGGRHLR